MCRHLSEQLQRPMSLDEAHLFICTQRPTVDGSSTSCGGGGARANGGAGVAGNTTPGAGDASGVSSGGGGGCGAGGGRAGRFHYSAREVRDWLVDQDIWAPPANAPDSARGGRSVGSARSGAGGAPLDPQDYRPFREVAQAAAHRAVADNITGSMPAADGPTDSSGSRGSGRRTRAAKKATQDSNTVRSQGTARTGGEGSDDGCAPSEFVSEQALEGAAEQHVKALHAMRISRGHRNSADVTTRYMHWGTVALPLTMKVGPIGFHARPPPPTATGPRSGRSRAGDDDDEDDDDEDGDGGKALRGSLNRSQEGPLSEAFSRRQQQGRGQGLHEGGEALSQRLLTDAKLFRPLATQWASGADIEDSLYWISYATQPSNVLPANPPPQEDGGVQLRDLREAADEKKEAVAAVASLVGPGGAPFVGADHSPTLQDTPQQGQQAQKHPALVNGALAGGGADMVRRKHEELLRQVLTRVLSLIESFLGHI